MEKKKTVLMVLVMCISAGILFASGTSEKSDSAETASAAEMREVKIALDAPPDPEKSGTYVWASTFEEYLKSQNVPTMVYQRDALGGEEEKLDQVRQALLEVSMSDVAMVGGLEKKIYGFVQPYMFKSLEHLDRTVANSDLLDKINESIAADGVKVLALVSSGVPSGLANTKKPVKTPSDLSGIRLRAKDGTQAKFIEAWGAKTVVVPWGEIYNSLQTGVADGYLNPPVVPLMFKHEEILKYFSDIAFTIPIRAAICSYEWYNGLSDAQRKLVDDAVAKATEKNRAWKNKRSKKALNDLRNAGLDVYDNTESEKRKFADLVKPVYNETLGEETANMFIEAAEANR